MLGPWSKKARQRRQLRDAPTVRLADVREGDRIKVVGRIRAVGPMLTAPVTGRACVYSRLRVWEPRGEFLMPVLFTEEQASDFELEDESGSVQVRLRGAEIIVVEDRGEVTELADPLQVVQDLLERHQIEWRSKFWHKAIRWSEGVLEPDERVAIWGVAGGEIGLSDTAGSAGSYREAPRRLVLTALAEAPLHVSDDPELFSKR